MAFRTSWSLGSHVFERGSEIILLFWHYSPELPKLPGPPFWLARAPEAQDSWLRALSHRLPGDAQHRPAGAGAVGAGRGAHHPRRPGRLKDGSRGQATARKCRRSSRTSPRSIPAPCRWCLPSWASRAVAFESSHLEIGISVDLQGLDLHPTDA